MPSPVGGEIVVAGVDAVRPDGELLDLGDFAAQDFQAQGDGDDRVGAGAARILAHGAEIGDLLGLGVGNVEFIGADGGHAMPQAFLAEGQPHAVLGELDLAGEERGIDSLVAHGGEIFVHPAFETGALAGTGGGIGRGGGGLGARAAPRDGTGETRHNEISGRHGRQPADKTLFHAIPLILQAGSRAGRMPARLSRRISECPGSSPSGSAHKCSSPSSCHRVRAG